MRTTKVPSEQHRSPIAVVRPRVGGAGGADGRAGGDRWPRRTTSPPRRTIVHKIRVILCLE